LTAQAEKAKCRLPYKKIKVEESLSGIEVALTKRFDKLTKLLDVTKGYAVHEKETLSMVISMRKDMSVSELNETCSKMNAMGAHINAIAEAYPQLRSAEAFLQLQSGIRDAEEHLQAARRLYNSNVTAFNTAIVMFPSSIVAGVHGMQKAEFFTDEEHKKADVSMTF
jgi:LemA protein